MFNLTMNLNNANGNGSFRVNHSAFNHVENQYSLPIELILEVFSHLKCKTLGVCAQVDKGWKHLTNQCFSDKKEKLYRDVVFSPVDWIKHFGENFTSHEEVALAFQLFHPNVDEIPCPIDKTKKLSETHIIAWIPKGFSINKLGEIFKQIYPENQDGYGSVLKKFIIEYGDIPVEKCEWIAMTKSVVPNSLDKNFSEQEKLVSKIQSGSKKRYKIPTLVEAIVCLTAEFFKRGVKTFEHPHIRCQESISRWQSTIGFTKEAPTFGLILGQHGTDCRCTGYGSAALRKF